MLGIFKTIQFAASSLFFKQTYNFARIRSWNLFKQYKEQDYLDIHKINQTLRTKIQRRRLKSQYGLFHGKQAKTGWKTCYSEKKSIRWFKPNTQKKTFYSDILNRKFQLHVTTTTLKNMRKVGGFDNYILLTKSKKLDSIYGEYLRKVMLNKLNNPNWKVPYLVKSQKHKHPTHRRLLRWPQKDAVWHPPEQRNIDLSHLRFKMPHQMNRKELAKFKQLEELDKKFEDVQTNHPLVKELQEQLKKEEEILEPERQKALEQLKKVKSKRQLREMMKIIEEGQKEFLNPPVPKE